MEGPETVGLMEVLEEHWPRGAKLGKRGLYGGTGIEYPKYLESSANAIFAEARDTLISRRCPRECQPYGGSKGVWTMQRRQWTTGFVEAPGNAGLTEALGSTGLVEALDLGGSGLVEALGSSGLTEALGTSASRRP